MTTPPATHAGGRVVKFPRFSMILQQTSINLAQPPFLMLAALYRCGGRAPHDGAPVLDHPY
jgi:hypothetical protein